MHTRPASALRLVSLLLGLLALGVRAASAQTSGTWTGVDVGEVGAAGSSSESGGVVTLNGSGADIGGTLDEFYWRYLSWTGDGVFMARLTGVSSVDNWAKIGIMMRADLSAGAASIFAGVNPAHVAAEVVRPTSGGTATLNSAQEDIYRALPMWVKLIRDGDDFLMYFSKDGTTWRPLGAQVTVPMSATALLGLAITSKADGRIATGTLDGVQFGPIVPYGLSAIARSPARVELRWYDQALRETGFEVERSSDNVSFTRIGTPAASANTSGNYVQFFDDTATPNATFWYRVRSIGPAGGSAYSNTISVTTPPVPPAGWLAQDIGNTTAGGSLTESGGTYHVTGSGLGVGAIDTIEYISGYRGIEQYSITGGEDQFFLAAKAVTTDSEIVARINPIAGPSGAQAGILVRGGTTANAADIFIFLRPDGSGRVRTRVNAPNNGFGHTDYRTAETALPAGGSGALWAKLVRTGGGVMAYTSRDGVTWTDTAWAKPAYGTDLLFGFGVASGQDGAVVTGTFDQVSIGPVTTSIAPPAPFDLAAVNIGINSINLTWSERTKTSDGVEVQRSTDGVNFTSIYTNQYGAIYDKPLTPDTQYYYRARAVRGTVTSAFSNVVAARTLPMPAAPSELVATAVSAGQVDLQWRDNSVGESAFVVERSFDNVTFQNVTQTIYTTWSDRNAVGDTVQYYRVKAISEAGDSPYSNVASARTPALSPTGRPTIAQQPASQAAATNTTVAFQTSSPSSTAYYQWYHDGYTVGYNSPYASALSTNTAQWSVAGIYWAVITDAGASSETQRAILGILSTDKVNFAGTEVGPNILHPNGNTYDQVLATNFTPAITADPGQVTRLSYVDLNNDIVQVEFSGAGTLTMNLYGYSAPAPAASYNQPEVSYVKGHAGIVIAGADETTNVSVFSVGRKTALNQAIFRDDVTYDGLADLAYIAILSTNGKFGGVYAGNASFWADQGIAGIYAPGVTFLGPVNLGDISARGTALPMLWTGPTAGTRIAGGDMAQTNGTPVQVGTNARIQFTAGEDSQGRPLSAKTNQAHYQLDGRDVTADVAPAP